MNAVDQCKMLNSIKRSGCSEFAIISLHTQSSGSDADKKHCAVVEDFYNSHDQGLETMSYVHSCGALTLAKGHSATLLLAHSLSSTGQGESRG